jgi:hypothetical protein
VLDFPFLVQIGKIFLLKFGWYVRITILQAQIFVNAINSMLIVHEFLINNI